MADAKRPTINVTRGERKPRRAAASERETRESGGGWSAGLGALPMGLARNARDVWLAGLGALAVVEDQGTKLFRALVEEGKTWEQERREGTEATLWQVATETDRAETATSEAIDEQVVHRMRQGVDAALARAGVPTRAALDDLHGQVDALAQKADRLAEQLEATGDEATG